MAKRKAAKGNTGDTTTSDGVEPVLIALAEQLGTFLGRVQKKADHLLENEAVQQQVSQIRDGATQLLERVNRASADARKSAAKVSTAVKSKLLSAKPAAPEAPARKPRSGGTVDAPGKKHRKPPPQVKGNRHMAEPKVQQMGQKGIKGRMQRGGSGS